ncbi:DUF4263 domain-containing protein [Sinorhizobium sp. 8-89]|uniref:Shedu anti-phage system protein SduA domain-containing protein n=1 Tax=Sinorhizobium sp. 7-81 TaxID=3049087 RepID=UPI0024C3A12E|nr:Shedu anti-phage system protein SduA domain-containing protein [Sinorhizobium sp. 7-81]MDK1389651.1 DUF4263 domain-containing protein [Sinorhizobium sp. 7-81]
MKSLIEDKYIEEFKVLLSKPGRQENAIQAFLEQHTTFLPTPGLLNHRLHLNSIISKFPIGERVADYAYLTKSSDEWKLVLVELEDAGKKLFTQSSKHVGFTSEMNDAIAQVDVWREFWNENRRTVLDSLEHLLVPPERRIARMCPGHRAFSRERQQRSPAKALGRLARRQTNPCHDL